MDHRSQHTNILKGKKTLLDPFQVKSFMFQVLNAIDHMHKNDIFHRDIKPLSYSYSEKIY